MTKFLNNADIKGYIAQTAVTSYLIKADSTGRLVAAIAGTDYQAPTTALLPAGGTAGQILAKIDGTNYNTQWIDNYTPQVKHDVKLGAALSKGTPVYVSSANGTNMIVSAASNASEATSSKTLGLLETGGALNDTVKVITEGLLAGLNTSTATAGDPVWLGPNGTLLFGLANKPSAPVHMVSIGIVTRVQSVNGEIFVKVQNGFELDELHNVALASSANNEGLFYDSATSLWKNKTIAAVLGYTPANDSAVVHLAGTETITGIKTFSSVINASTLSLNGGTLAGNNIVSMRSNPTGGQFRIEKSDGSLSAYPFYIGVDGTALAYYYNASGALKVLLHTDGTSYFGNSLSVGYSTYAATSYSLDVNGSAQITSTLQVGGNLYGVGATFSNAVTAASIIKSGGTSSQFLKADGSVDSNAYITSSSLSSYLPLTGGTLTGDLTLSGTNPRLYFTDTDNNPDYFISNTDGTFTVYDVTNSVGRFKIYSGGNAEFTGALIGTGATFSNAVNITGANLGHAANKTVLSQEGSSNGAFWQSYGANTTTVGKFTLRQYSSDASVSIIPLSIETSGAATFSGSLTTNGTFNFAATGNVSFTSNDANNYARFTGNSASAQIGLFRASDGGMYIGGSANGFRVFDSSFNTRLLLAPGGQLQLNTYTSATSYTGTAAGYLAFDSSGNIITVAGVTGTDNTKLPLAGGTMTGALVVAAGDRGFEVNASGGISLYSNEINAGALGGTGTIYMGWRRTTQVNVGVPMVLSSSISATSASFSGSVTINNTSTLILGIDDTMDRTVVGGASRTRLQLAPPSHTGAEWTFVTYDDSSNAYIRIGYGNGSASLQMRHDGYTTIAGNVVIHSANYSSYALPLSGGTLAGPVTLNDSSYFRGSPTYGFRFNNNADTLNLMSVRATGDMYVRGQVYVGGDGFSSGTQLVYNSGSWGISVTGSAAYTTYLSALGDYVFDATTNGRSFNRGIQTSFVSASQSYPSYGSVVRIRTYTGLEDGGTAELYFPYNSTYGGSSMRYRMGQYANAGWTNWKTVIDSDNIGSQSVSYANTAGSANNIDGWSFVNTGSNSGTDANTIASNGISYVNANANLLGQTDGALYSQAYNSDWQHQIYGDYRTGQIVLRGKNSGTWQSWRTVLDTSNSPGISGAKYQLNNDWLRVNYDDRQFQIYGNARTMIYRTDGNNNSHGGGGYAHIFYYGGSADTDRKFIINTDGRLYSPYHGWLDTMSISGSAGSATTAQRIETGNNQWTWSTGAHTATNPNSITLWDQYSTYGGSGSPETYGTILDIYGRSAHEHDQLMFGASGNILHRSCFYGTNTWGSWKIMLDESNAVYATTMNQHVGTSYSPTFANVYVNSWFRVNTNNTGLYSEANNIHFYATSDKYWNIGSGGSSSGGLVLRQDHQTTVKGYVYWNGDGFGLLNNQGGWSVLCYQGTGYGGELRGSWTMAGSTIITSGSIGSQSVATSNQTYRSIIEDTRGGQRTPNDYDDYRVSYEFTNQMPHDGNWLSIMTMQGWHNGYTAWQIQGPATSSAYETWYLRSGINGSWNSARTIIHSGNIGSQSVNNSAQLDGYGRSNFLGLNGNSYYQANTWIQLNGWHGLYAPSWNGAHWMPNNASTYTTWRIAGSRNSYSGVYDDYSGVNMLMYDSGGNGGVYRENNGRWYWYYHLGNACMAIGNSGTSSSYVLYVHGAIYATGDVVAYSDSRKKTNVITVDNPIETITKMRGVFYDKIGEEEKGRQIGVIAQEVNEILPEAVTYASDIDEYGVKYGNMAGLFIEAIKEQQKQIEELKSIINDLTK